MARVTFKYTQTELQAQAADDHLLLHYREVLQTPASASASELDKARRWVDGGYARRRKARRDAAQKRADDAKAKRQEKKSSEILAAVMQEFGDDPAKADGSIDPQKLALFEQLSSAPTTDVPSVPVKPAPLAQEELTLWAAMQARLETLPGDDPVCREARKYLQDRLDVFESRQAEIDDALFQEIRLRVEKLLDEVRLRRPNAATVAAIKEKFNVLIEDASALTANPARDESGARLDIVYKRVTDFLVATRPRLNTLAPKSVPPPEYPAQRKATLTDALDDFDRGRERNQRWEEEHRRQLTAILAGKTAVKEVAAALDKQEIQQADGTKITNDPFHWLGERKQKLLDKFDATSGNLEERDLRDFCRDPKLDSESFVFVGKRSDGTEYRKFGNGTDAVPGKTIFGRKGKWFVVPDFGYQLAEPFAEDAKPQPNVPTPTPQQWAEMERTLRPGCRWVYEPCSGAWIQAAPGETGDGLQATHVLKEPLEVVWLKGADEPADYDPKRYSFFYGRFFKTEPDEPPSLDSLATV